MYEFVSLREKHQYESDIEQLREQVNQLNQIIEEQKRIILLREKSLNAERCEVRMLKGEHELPTDKARKLIKRAKLDGFEGSVLNQCKLIGQEVGLVQHTVKVLWYEKNY